MLRRVLVSLRPVSQPALPVVLAVLLLAVAAVAAQVFTAPQGRVENVTFEQEGSVINITYDLVSEDATATFNVTLEVSLEGGTQVTVRPANVSGDIGASVRPGAGKTIRWQAGNDMETPQLNRLAFTVRALSGTALPDGSAPAGRLRVRTTTPNVTVLVDGSAIDGLEATVPAGVHVLLFRAPGFVENRREVTVEANETAEVEIALTPDAAGSAPPPPPQEGGGMPKWVLPVIGAAGAGAFLALRGAGTVENGPVVNGPDVNGPPTCTSFQLSQSSWTAPAGGGSLIVQVTAGPSGCTGGAWNASVASGGSFLTVSPMNGTAGGTVTITALANPTPNVQMGSVTIAGQTVTVTQTGGVTCAYQFTPFAPDPPPINPLCGVTDPRAPWCIGGGSNPNARQINWTASNSQCGWTVSTGGASWLTATPSSATGTSGQVRLGVGGTTVARWTELTFTPIGASPVVFIIAQRP